MMGNTSNELKYIQKSNNERVYTNEEIEQEYRRVWTEHFKITPEENRKFDMQTERTVNNFLQENQHLITPTATVNLDILDPNDPLIKPISMDEIEWAINKTKPRAPGPSQINKETIAHIPHNMKVKYQTICNMLLSTGHFPTKFKHAHIRFIPKPGKPPEFVENSRPVSLLETPGKLLEMILNKRLKDYLEDNEMHNPRQYGFRPGKGTEHAIALAHEEIAQNMKNKKQTTVILRDVSKAFDKVWHQGLMYKMINMNLPIPFTRLLSNFLTGRTASVKINEYVGPPIPLLSGTPQGAILSPTLYTIMTRDMPPATYYHNYIMYADDVTQIISSESKRPGMQKRNVERAVNNVNEYEKLWKIQTNTQKFKVIPIAKHKPPEITIDNRNIRNSTQGTLLGLELFKCGVSKHVTSRRNKASVIMGKLNRFRHCTVKTKRKIYTSIVRPKLEYPPIPLHAVSENQMVKLQRIQNRALRWISGIRYPEVTTNKALHERFEIESLNVRLHNRAKKTWERLEAMEDPLYQQLVEGHDYTKRDHSWFHRSIPIINQINPPEPIYKSERRRDRNALNNDESDDSDDSDDSVDSLY